MGVRRNCINCGGFGMETTINSIVAVNNASAKAGIELAQLGINALAKVIKLQTKAAVRLYPFTSGNDSIPAAKTSGFTGAERPFSWPKQWLDGSIAYSRDLTDVALWSQSVASRILDDAFAEVHRGVLETVEKNVLHPPRWVRAWTFLWPPQTAVRTMTDWVDASNRNLKQLAEPTAKAARVAPSRPKKKTKSKKRA